MSFQPASATPALPRRFLLHSLPRHFILFSTVPYTQLFTPSSMLASVANRVESYVSSRSVSDVTKKVLGVIIQGRASVKQCARAGRGNSARLAADVLAVIAPPTPPPLPAPAAPLLLPPLLRPRAQRPPVCGLPAPAGRRRCTPQRAACACPPRQSAAPGQNPPPTALASQPRAAAAEQVHSRFPVMG